jgi:hypothetical protein
MNQPNIFTGPALVVGDARAKTYARYYGSRLTMKVQGEVTLNQSEVELFRADPFKFMGMESA